MYPYIKWWHPIITAVIVIILIMLGVRAQGRVLTGLTIGAFLFALITAILLWAIVLEMGNRRTNAITDYMEQLARLDPEKLAILAWQFPTMRYRMKRGEVRAEFEDTGVPIEHFRIFLQTSNSKYISPRRDWYTHEKPESSWIAIQSWLLENGLIIPDSAAGSHSWLWNGNSYQYLTAYWMAGRTIPNMADNLVFSFDGPTPPPEEDVQDG